MKQTLIDCPGLVTAPGPAGNPGALRRAAEMMCRRPGVYEQRRSYVQDDLGVIPYPLMNGGTYIVSLFAYDGDLFALTSDGAIFRRGDTSDVLKGWLQLWVGDLPTDPGSTVGGGQANVVQTGYLRSAQLNGNAYLGLRGGTFRMTGSKTPATYWGRAGMPRGREMLLSAAGAVGFLTAAGQSVAYRVTWAQIDANNNLIEGAPSGRFVFTAAGACNVLVKTWLPSDINATSYFIRVYRSRTAAAGVVPDDNLQLVWQSNVTATDLANGYVTFTDVQPDGLRGAAGYFTGGQDGTANGRPPIAYDVVAYKGSLFFGNTQSYLSRATTQMLSIPQRYPLNGAGAQVQANTPSAGQATYTFATGTYDFSGLDASCWLAVKGCTNAGNNGDFAVVSVNSGTGKIVVTNGGAVNEAAPPVGAEAMCAALGITHGAETRAHASYTESLTAPFRFGVAISGTDFQNVQATVPSILRALNQSQSVVVVTDIASDTDAPGKLLFEGSGSVKAYGFTTSAVSGGAQFANKFAPALGTALQLVADVVPGRVMWSKPFQPEHVPETNYQDLGGKKFAVQRIIALRDSVLVFTLGAGLWRIVGDGSGQWSFTVVDPTVFLLGNNMACSLHGEVYALTNRGMLAISDAGRHFVSGPVQDSLSKLFEKDGLSVPGHLSSSDLDGMVYVYARFAPTNTLGARTLAFQLMYCPATGKWTGDVKVLSLIQGDPSLLSLPGVQFNYQGAGQVFRHGVATDARDIFREAVYDDREPPASNAFQSQMPVPADGYRFKTTAWNAGTKALTVTANNATHAIAVGDVVRGEGPNYLYYWQVAAINGSVLTLTPYLVDASDAGRGFAAGGGEQLYVMAGLPAVIEAQPYSAGDLYSQKVFLEAGLLFGDYATADSVTLMFTSDLDSTPEGGTSQVLEYALRGDVPSLKRRCNRLVFNASFSKPLKFFTVHGLSYEFERTAAEGSST